MPYLINNIGDAADQFMSLALPDGSSGSLELLFMGSTNRWIFNLTHSDLPNGALNGQMLCVHPNILRNFKNLLSFGMACTGANGLDPVNIESFANGSNRLYILDAVDVLAVEQNSFGEFVPPATS